MPLEFVTEIIQRAILLVLWLSAPFVISAAVIGLLFGLIQALTQIQDQTTQFAVKAIVLFGLCAVLGGWVGSEVAQYAERVFQELARLR
jgi:type III secretion protein S